MNKLCYPGILIILTISIQTSFADVLLTFSNPAAEQRYYDLIKEIRCLVCQNQSLADSNADLAQGLRNEIYQRLEKGQSDQEIIAFLVARYGDFVLYRPPLKGNTWLLWLGPFLFLIIAFIIVMLMIRKQSNTPPQSVDMSQTDQNRIDEILGKQSDRSKP